MACVQRLGPAIALLMAFVPAACGSPVGPESAGHSLAPTKPAPAASSTALDPVASGAARGPAFMSARLTDVRTGAEFALSDLAGKRVLVQGMAVW